MPESQETKKCRVAKDFGNGAGHLLAMGSQIWDDDRKEIVSFAKIHRLEDERKMRSPPILLQTSRTGEAPIMFIGGYNG